MISPAPLTAAVRRAGLLLAAVVLCVYVATAGGSLTSVDAVMTYEVTHSLVTAGATSFDRAGINNHLGVDGRYYSPFGIGQSLFNLPFFLAARAAERTLGLRIGRADTLEKAGVALGSTVAATGAVWVLFLFAWRLSGNLEASAATALACAFGTLLWPYSKFGFNQALTTWCLTAGVYAGWLGVRLDRRGLLAWSGIWLACAFLTRHEMALAAVVMAAWIAFESRTDPARGFGRLVWFGFPLAVAVGFWLWYNAVRFGHPFDTGNLGPTDSPDDQHFTFSRSILVGVSGLLFSPGRSVFFYAPLVAAGIVAWPALARRDRSLAALVAGVSLSLLVLYGSLRYWDGLRGYGPRYLVPLLPLILLPLVYGFGATRWKRPLLAAVLLSALVQLPGVLVDYSKVSVEHAATVGDYSRDDKIYSFARSALILNTRAALKALPANARNVWQGSRPAGADVAPGQADANFAQRFSFSLDFWWLYLYYLGAYGSGVALALGVMPIAVAAILAAGLRRAVRTR